MHLQHGSLLSTTPPSLSALPSSKPLHQLLRLAAPTRCPQQQQPYHKPRRPPSLACSFCRLRLWAEHHSSQALWTGLSHRKYSVCDDFSFLTTLLLPAALQTLHQVKVNEACLNLYIGLSIGLLHFRTRCQQSTCLAGFLCITSYLWERICLFCLGTAGLHVLGSCLLC